MGEKRNISEGDSDASSRPPRTGTPNLLEQMKQYRMQQMQSSTTDRSTPESELNSSAPPSLTTEASKGSSIGKSSDDGDDEMSLLSPDKADECLKKMLEDSDFYNGIDESEYELMYAKLKDHDTENIEDLVENEEELERVRDQLKYAQSKVTQQVNNNSNNRPKRRKKKR